jgi:hypothetical protein
MDTKLQLIEAAIRKEIRYGTNPAEQHNELDAMIAELPPMWQTPKP